MLQQASQRARAASSSRISQRAPPLPSRSSCLRPVRPVGHLAPSSMGISTIYRKAISSPDLTADKGSEQGPASPLQPSVFTATKTKGYFTVQGRLVLPSSALHVYEILTDHSSTARIFRNVEDCRRSPDGKTLTQTCKWTFMAISGSFDLKLAVNSDPGQLVITFSILESTFMKGFDGRWHVIPLEDGSCRVEHELSMKPLVPIPPPISYYTSAVLEKEVLTVLLDLEQEVLRQRAEGLGPQR